jgi:hypothetical protein
MVPQICPNNRRRSVKTLSQEQSALWVELFELLRHKHMKASHTVADVPETVERLFHKHPAMRNSGTQPKLPRERERLMIDIEEWDLPRLWSVVHQGQRTEAEPDFEQGAVAILRWGGTDYLIDGRRRINLWQRKANRGPHRVLVVSDAAIHH